MFAYVRGQLVKAAPEDVIIECGGIGYRIFIPMSVFGKLPQIGTTVVLYTSYVVRELSHTLYGFLNTSDCDLFEMLMSVTGIGPKLALSIIGHLSAMELQQAINKHDLATICRVPGIGKKTAERLVIELRDKLAEIITTSPSDLACSQVLDPKKQFIQDAMNALINLGYSQNIAQKAIKQSMQEVGDDSDLASLIRLSLKHV